MPAVFLLSHLLPPGLINITLKENQKYKQIISTKRMYINSTKNEGLWSWRDLPCAWGSHSFFPFSTINFSKLVHSSKLYLNAPPPRCIFFMRQIRKSPWELRQFPAAASTNIPGSINVFLLVYFRERNTLLLILLLVLYCISFHLVRVFTVYPVCLNFSFLPFS